jgi:hypothetical protein
MGQAREERQRAFDEALALPCVEKEGDGLL